MKEFTLLIESEQKVVRTAEITVIADNLEQAIAKARALDMAGEVEFDLNSDDVVSYEISEL